MWLVLLIAFIVCVWNPCLVHLLSILQDNFSVFKMQLIGSLHVVFIFNSLHFCFTGSNVNIINVNSIQNECSIWTHAAIHWSVYKIHIRLDCDREYIEHETVSAFSNWPAPSVPQGLLLTQAKDSVLSAATYPQQCASNECHSVLVLINSANPLREPNTVQASVSAQNQCATLSMFLLTAPIAELLE